MNYYAARELRDDQGNPTGRYHYTCRNDGHVFAVGACSPWETCPDCHGLNRFYMGRDYREQMGIPECPRCENKGIVKKANPCPGHATPEEACAHQKEYEVENAVFYPETPEIRRKCCQLFRCDAIGCMEFTCGLATYGLGHMDTVHLCSTHCNRETLATLVSVGKTISSC